MAIAMMASGTAFERRRDHSVITAAAAAVASAATYASFSIGAVFCSTHSSGQLEAFVSAGIRDSDSTRIVTRKL